MRAAISAGAITALVIGQVAVAAPAFGGDHIPPAWKHRTSLRVVPDRPRQNDFVRLFVHCPPAANHAIVGSTAFALKGSRRLYREVGVSLSDRGLGRDAVSVSYYALPGDHDVLLRCVRVTMDHRTWIRKIKVVGRYAVPLRVRRFTVGRFFG
ncbi:hypothetical protein MF672_029340 [Actinomadura sp. ATCC 31491]|uniref:Uncharacterized protein n=1 Tax=Actinomadura luzonensis TaxID=2805427 RepID=A0ABT0FZZ8_9ACTN|nr:hypothetical protein [Actinomadura luzonensis]MCK2217870.1 hypothetical protein [Actinomadura luzonensis]